MVVFNVGNIIYLFVCFLKSKLYLQQFYTMCNRGFLELDGTV